MLAHGLHLIRVKIFEKRPFVDDTSNADWNCGLDSSACEVAPEARLTWNGRIHSLSRSEKCAEQDGDPIPTTITSSSRLSQRFASSNALGVLEADFWPGIIFRLRARMTAMIVMT